MSAPRMDPCGCCDLQIGFRYPDSPGDGQFRKRMLGLDYIHLVNNQPETVSHVYYRCVHGLSGGGRKDQPNRICFAADRKRMNFERGSLVRNGRAYLKHVGAQDLTTIFQVIGVVFHKSSAAFESLAHDFDSPDQSCRFPVTFRPETIAIRHQTLNSDSRELGKAMQVLKCVGESMRPGFLEKM